MNVHQRKDQRKPKVALIVSGGTISAVGNDRLDLAAYQESGRALAAPELVARVPELQQIADIEVVNQANARGPRADLDGVVAATQQIADIASRRSIRAIIVTRGTNTLEEFAYAAHLGVASAKPIVFVGAMRPASGLSFDGDLNLLRAAQVATDPAVRGLGVLVLLNDRIYSARDVTKGATYRLDAFTGRDLGPLGYADADGRIVVYHRHLRRHTTRSLINVDRVGRMPRVEIVTSYVGSDGTLIDAAVEAGASGVVVAGMGAGFPTDSQMMSLRRAQEKGVLVTISSRVGSGRTTLRPALMREGFLAADNLVPWKARILLAYGIASEMSASDIQDVFDSH